MRDTTVDRPVDQSHFECNKCPLDSLLKRKVLHFSLTQTIEITQCVSPSFKRKSTLGMGTDQGRTSNLPGLAALASLTGSRPEDVGTTTFRPPFAGVRMSTVAGVAQGDLYRPRRHLPAHEAHVRRGAVFQDFGWQRPDWYRHGPHAEREAAVACEVGAVRKAVGIFDGSSLGKIEIAGPDAAAFISRFYVSNMASLRQGRIRYSVMLRENGVVFDDGVVMRLAENLFLACPTSANADSVAAWFERWRQTEWPDMHVSIVPVTSQWATMAIAGPNARQLLQRLAKAPDLSPEAFPHMAVREGIVAGMPARVARVSFTGELQYEVSVAARCGEKLLEQLLETGGDLGAEPVGLEAWLRLRLDKGYVHVGSETNGRTTPLDLGMAEIVRKRCDDYIGARSLSLPSALKLGREQLVGLMTMDGDLKAGGRILRGKRTLPPCATDGYVTSAAFSHTMGRSIGLALVEDGSRRIGETVRVFCGGRIVTCRLTVPVFYDPSNERMAR
ncbi:MAG: glycine cleavage T C-terminal barrel domain-containing protein [Pseudaminobacter sp.]